MTREGSGSVRTAKRDSDASGSPRPRDQGRRPRQAIFPFARARQRRRGGGRKPKGEQAGVPHARRARLTGREPVHVTLKLEHGLPSLRNRDTLRVLRAAFLAGKERNGFRLVHFSAQTNHLHLLVEACDRHALSRGMQGLCVRLARGLNRLWERRGRVFADRYHEHVLRTRPEVRNALRYVLANHRRHGRGEPGPDVYSSGAWFDGWTVCVDWLAERSGLRPVATATTWLLTKGWRSLGAIAFAEVPGG